MHSRIFLFGNFLWILFEDKMKQRNFKKKIAVEFYIREENTQTIFIKKTNKQKLSTSLATILEQHLSF